MNEIFKAIPGYEGIYEVSNFGRIKSLRVWCPRIKQYKEREKILDSWTNNVGYKIRVLVDKNGEKRCWSVHRLVAITFIDNPNNLSDVDHIDGDKNNNRVDNLQWLTHKENMRKMWYDR